MSEPRSPEQRQHINLSSFAYEVIQNDAITMIGKKNISGFICNIIDSYGESFTDLAEINRDYPKDIPIKIRLRSNIYDEYYPRLGNTWFGARYKKTQGEYIKAIIENYSRKTFYFREQVFYKTVITKLNDHIQNTSRDKGILPIITEDGNKMYIKPLRLSYDYEAPYNYIICYSTLDINKEMIPVSIRVSRIKDVKNAVTSYGSGNLKNKEVKELERRAKDNGVPYIIGKLEYFKVKLTSYGWNRYNTIFHLRPMYDSIEIIEDNCVILELQSTRFQVENYFFAFGKEATILQPIELKKQLHNKFTEAANSYTSV